MNTLHPIDRKRYISFPVSGQRLSVLHRVMRYLFGLALLPFVLVVAWFRGTPGLQVRMRCIAFGLRALASGNPRQALFLVVNPMDSFRYFEFDFVQRVASRSTHVRYLDVSSPRLVPMMILDHQNSLAADIINPIAIDLLDTAVLAKALHLEERCRLQQILIEEVDHPDETFDLITSISVVEHIPNDSEAIAKMWRLLRPGGRLLITVPCAREASEEYTNVDEYGLFASRDGFVYWQRYYDEAALTQRIWRITGTPNRMWIFGEVVAGSYDDNVMQKRTNPRYPFWWEPMMMGRDYRHFDQLDQLSGMGVIAMEFSKSSSTL